MLKLYAQADGFCLPSLSDPNPLATIEALWARLPLLLSNRVGNHPECLEEAQNGFLFDPQEASSIVTAVTRWLMLSPQEFDAYGAHSTQIARQNFSPEDCIRDFLDAALPASCGQQVQSMSSARQR